MPSKSPHLRCEVGQVDVLLMHDTRIAPVFRAAQHASDRAARVVTLRERGFIEHDTHRLFLPCTRLWASLPRNARCQPS
ncbi:uncharacterized protein CMC5_077050 [Chondromyces crocatus]|uniref:Uncharacterized protein n=1 Tax=Chondromyces crocatus TaxID=52 RepID=A0A0K1ES77_CHOCO|nr:uncharacterized protein CMC5_077050 [Chondromyces crocatus]